MCTKVPKKLPPEDTSLPLPSGEAHITIFNPDMESPRAELGNILGFITVIDYGSSRKMNLFKVSQKVTSDTII